MTSWLDTTPVQRYDCLLDARPSATLTLGEALDSIVDGAYAATITHLRQIYARHGEDAYVAAKRRLPQITFGGVFSPTRAKANLMAHSGIAHADIDHLQALTQTKLALMQDPHVVYLFISPRNDGLKYGTRIAPVDNDDAYKHAWQVLADAHLRQYAVTWDPSGKDVCRLCFVSWDPSCYINPDAAVFPVPARVVPTPSPVTADGHWPSPRLQTAAQRALERAVQLIADAEPGHQHVARCRAAYLAGGYVGSGQLAYEDAYSALEGAVQDHAKNTRKAMRDITDGLTAGQARPISYPPRQRGGDWRSRARAPEEVPQWRKC